MNAINPTTTPAWARLQQLAEDHKDMTILSQFDKKERFDRLSITIEDILVDFSKNRLNEEILNTLFDLAGECKLQEAIEDMFSGKPINVTEGRAVLHTALRNVSCDAVLLDGKNIMEDVNAVLEKM